MIFAAGAILLLIAYWMRHISLGNPWVLHWSDFWPYVALVGSALATASVAILAWRHLP